MKRLAGLLLLSLAACPSEDPGPVVVAPLPPQSVARLVSKEGTVTLFRGTESALASPGPLQVNDVLETGPQSKALLRAPGGREIELGESTKFKVGKNLGDVEVTEGTISFLASDEGDGGVTQVTTKYGKTTVAPGTRATLVAGEQGLSVDVSVGEITQLGDDGGTRNVAAGEKLEFGIGAIEVVDPGEKPKVYDVQLLADGRVLVKKKGESKFALAKKGPGPIPEGAALQVGPGGRARLSVDGAAVKLGPGATGTVDGASSGADGNELGLTVNGPASIALDGKAPAVVKLGGKTPVTLKGKGESALVVNKGKVEVLVGEVELEAFGKKQKVKGGEVASVGPKGVEVAQRARPSLVVPLGKKVRVYSKRGALAEVGLGLPDELTRMQVANDAAFTDVVLEGPADDFVAVPAPVTGELHWRTVDEKGEATATGRVRFMPDVGATKDEARGDVVTETGLKASIFFQGAVPTLTFTFPEVEGAKGYRLRVYRAGDLSKPLVDKQVKEAKAAVDPGVLTEGSFRWSASALDEAGNDKVGGRMNQLDIIFDNSLTTLQISAPRDGDRADGAKAAGTAPLGSKLFVNGKPVATDGSGRFSQALPKAELVVFRLLSQDGSESFWFRRLKK